MSNYSDFCTLKMDTYINNLVDILRIYFYLIKKMLARLS